MNNWETSDTTHTLLGLPEGFKATVVQKGDKWTALIVTPKRTYTFKRAASLATTKRKLVNAMQLLLRSHQATEGK